VSAATANSVWPALPFEEWVDTCQTLHLWTQIVGKIRLASTPWQNHSWHVPLYVTPRGLSTSTMWRDGRSFEIEFDFIADKLVFTVSDGSTRELELRSQSVASFYLAVTTVLSELNLTTPISDYPCEIASALHFSKDEKQRTYNANHARRFWQALIPIDRIFKEFRGGFLGKASPSHFFWGSFDLAVTRFSGRTAPRFEGKVPGVAIEVMREAYSHEVSSAGFWPGGNGIDYPCFYSYAYPAPAVFKFEAVSPKEAFFSEALGEFLLPYDAVRLSSDPDATLHEFLQSTYEAAARTAQWDRLALERPQGSRVLRRV